jgi:hypothetical protein
MKVLSKTVATVYTAHIYGSYSKAEQRNRQEKLKKFKYQKAPPSLGD